jgi:hypothetical protein
MRIAETTRIMVILFFIGGISMVFAKGTADLPKGNLRVLQD